MTMIYKDIVFSIKFKQTYGTYKQFEIIYFTASALLISFVLPIIFVKEINSLYYCFILNSVLRYSLSHILFMRTKIALYEPAVRIRRMRIVLAVKLIIIGSFIIFPSVQSPHFLACKPDYLYPLEFLFIFVLDAIMAGWDLVVFMFTPNNMRKAF